MPDEIKFIEIPEQAFVAARTRIQSIMALIKSEAMCLNSFTIGINHVNGKELADALLAVNKTLDDLVNRIVADYPHRDIEQITPNVASDIIPNTMWLDLFDNTKWEINKTWYDLGILNHIEIVSGQITKKFDVELFLRRFRLIKD